jgi:hypothetical protein
MTVPLTSSGGIWKVNLIHSSGQLSLSFVVKILCNWEGVIMGPMPTLCWCEWGMLNSCSYEPQAHVWTWSRFMRHGYGQVVLPLAWLLLKVVLLQLRNVHPCVASIRLTQYYRFLSQSLEYHIFCIRSSFGSLVNRYVFLMPMLHHYAIWSKNGW